MKRCSSCHWFDPVDGYCAQREFYCRGTDGLDCEEYQPMRKRRADDEERVDWAAFIRGRVQIEDDN